MLIITDQFLGKPGLAQVFQVFSQPARESIFLKIGVSSEQEFDSLHSSFLIYPVRQTDRNLCVKEVQKQPTVGPKRGGSEEPYEKVLLH
ncbi:hypothetical protein RA26_11855 [Leisingera sp. ANG-M7]|nr:hypothetical protein RA26_11855 [Leisingera sp. ANG-M7]